MGSNSSQGRWDTAAELVVPKPQCLQRFSDVDQCMWDAACQLVVVEVQLLQIDENTQFRWDLARQGVAGEV